MRSPHCWIPVVVVSTLTCTVAPDASSSFEDLPTLSASMSQMRELVGTWHGVAEANDIQLQSVWTWTPVAAGDAIWLTVEEAFNGGPLEANMVELITQSPEGDGLSFSTANGRGHFVIHGDIDRTDEAIERRWSMRTSDGSVIRGRDVLALDGPDRIVWTQHLDRGEGWVEVPYSPFTLTRQRGA